MIYRLHVMHTDYLLRCNVTKHGDLLLGGLFQLLRSQESAGDLKQLISLNMRKSIQAFTHQVRE